MPFVSTLVFLCVLLTAPNLFAMPDYTTAHSTLGVSEDATSADIKAAYRKLAKEYSPNAVGVDKTKAEDFSAITMAKDLLEDPRYSSIYARMKKLSRTMHVTLPTVIEFSQYGPSQWEMLEKQLKNVEALQQAEELRRNPPVEDLIEFEDVLYGSNAENRLMALYSDAAEALGAELREFIRNSYPKSGERKLSRQVSQLAKDALGWAKKIEFTIDGKSLNFSDDFTAQLFRERIKQRLIKSAFVSAADSLQYYSYSGGPSVYDQQFRSYLEQVIDSKDRQLAFLIGLHRSKQNRGYLRGTREYTFLKAEPAKWAAIMKSAAPYVYNRLSKSQARDSFVEFLDDMDVPWPELQTETPLQKMKAATVIGARCVAFTAHGGFSVVETLMARRKLKTEASQK